MAPHPKLVRFWDRQAPTYDQKMSGVERRMFPQSRQWVCSRAQGATLEVAIGTGANLVHYPGDVELTGIDWSSAMLDLTRRRASDVDRGIGLHQGDAAALPFPDDTFDSVVSTFALCCIPQDQAAISEALRVLRPGGRLLLADHIASSVWPIRALQHAADLVSVPLHGEHFTRRPLDMLHDLGVPVVETERHRAGVIEHIHATPQPHVGGQAKP